MSAGTSNFKRDLIRFAEALSAEQSAAADLWSWLPSHKVAAKHHGDYAVEYCPSNHDVLVEAAMYVAHLLHPSDPLTAEARAWFALCPCGADHADGDAGATPSTTA